MTQINNSLKNIKKSKIDIKNENTIKMGTLIPEDIYKSNLSDIPNINDDLNDALDIANIILSSKLPKELQNDFEIKSEYVGNKIQFLTKPKSDGAYKKFPRKINYKFDTTGKSLEEIKRMTNIKELSKEANITGKPVKVGTILSSKEYLGEYENPAPLINDKDAISSELYIMPDPLPPGKKFKFEMFNEKFKFIIPVLNLRVKERRENSTLISNYECPDDYFDFEMIPNYQTTNNDYIEFSINIKCRENYVDDCFARLELYKFIILSRDQNTTLIMTDLEDNKEFYKRTNIGNRKYTQKDYKNISNEITLLGKLLYIEKTRGLKFKYDSDKIIRTRGFIELAYYDSLHKNATIKNKTYWTIPLIDKDMKNDITNNPKLIFNLETKIDAVEVLGIRLELKDNISEMSNCEIIKIDSCKKNSILHFKTDKIKINFLNNKTKE